MQGHLRQRHPIRLHHHLQPQFQPQPKNNSKNHHSYRNGSHRLLLCGTATPNEDGICLSCPHQCAYTYYDVDRRTKERRLHSCGRQAVAGAGVWPTACSLRTHSEQVDQIRYFRAQYNKGQLHMYGFLGEASHTATLRRPAPGAYARTTQTWRQVTDKSLAEHLEELRRESEEEVAMKIAQHESRYEI
jgi:hypothetical protein